MMMLLFSLLVTLLTDLGSANPLYGAAACNDFCRTNGYVTDPDVVDYVGTAPFCMGSCSLHCTTGFCTEGTDKYRISDGCWSGVRHCCCHQEKHVNCNGGWVEDPDACKQTYKIQWPAQGGGATCMHADGTTMDMNRENCNVDCQGAFQGCDSSCKNYYKITANKLNNGQECPHANMFSKACAAGEGDCPAPAPTPPPVDPTPATVDPTPNPTIKPTIHTPNPTIKPTIRTPNPTLKPTTYNPCYAAVDTCATHIGIECLAFDSCPPNSKELLMKCTKVLACGDTQMTGYVEGFVNDECCTAMKAQIGEAAPTPDPEHPAIYVYVDFVDDDPDNLDCGLVLTTHKCFQKKNKGKCVEEPRCDEEPSDPSDPWQPEIIDTMAKLQEWCNEDVANCKVCKGKNRDDGTCKTNPKKLKRCRTFKGLEVCDRIVGCHTGSQKGKKKCKGKKHGLM